jgi:tetratricopeptide (TPR) repeat protein
MAKPIRPIVLIALAAVLVVPAAGYWRYRVTRPEYRLRRGQAAVLQADLREAEQWAATLEAAGYPDYAHLLRGQMYFSANELNSAILEYDQINVARTDVLVEASLSYGLKFLDIKRPVEAESYLLYVVSVRPETIDARRGLAAIYYDRGAMSKALAQLEKWVELDPADGQPHRFMGVIYKDMGANAQAAEHYRAALRLRLSPKVRREVVPELAELLVRQNEYAEALQHLDNYPADGHAAIVALLELRAECLYGLGEQAESACALERAAALGRLSPRGLRLRALLHADADEFAAAANTLEQALRQDAHDCPCRYQLAQAYEHLGRRTDAAEQLRLLDRSQRLYQELSDLNQEANRKPTDVSVRRRLADVCAKLEKPTLAAMWLRAAKACPLPSDVEKKR